MSDAEITDAPKKRGRPPKAKPGDAEFRPTHSGPQPHFPVYGDSWESADGMIKFWHGSGWYLEPPGVSAKDRAADMAKAEIARTEPAPGTSAAAIAAMNSAAEKVDQISTVTITDNDDTEIEVIAEVEIDTAPVAQIDDDEELPAVANIDALAADFEIGELRYIVADSRDLVLAMIKEMPKLWGALPEAKQYDLARGIENGIAEMVQRIAEAVATKEKLPIRCFLESYVEKDGVKVTLKLKPAGEQEELESIIGLHKAKGKMVLLTAADADDYRAERRPETLPDEPGLVLDPPEHPDDDSDLAGHDTDYGAGDGD